MRYKKWNFTAPARPEVMSMTEAGLPVLAALVLCARGVDTPEKARAFLAVDGLPLPDPFLLCDMDKAAARIERALAGNEYIAVYGDYDVDGITSTASTGRRWTPSTPPASP